MTTKRTHGPCTCQTGGQDGHWPDCPSLYPAQQEPDALARLARHIRTAWVLTPNATDRISADDFEAQALSLISEAREEQRKAVSVVGRAPEAWRIGSSVRDERYKAEAAVQFMLNGRWGTCVECPRDADGFPRPEQCINTLRGDHQIDAVMKDPEP